MSPSSSFPGSAEAEESALECYDALLRDVSERLPQCDSASDLGDDLITEITSQEDFPPDYLSNIREKVCSLKALSHSVRKTSERLEERRDYLKVKRKFYNDLRSLDDQLKELEQWLAQPAASDDDLLLSECSRRKRMLGSMDNTVVADMKKLAGEVTLHAGAAEDPGNRIKADLYRFCDRWETLESGYGAKENKLLALAKAKVAEDRERRVSGGETDTARRKKNMTLELGDSNSSKRKSSSSSTSSGSGGDSDAAAKRKQLRDQLSQLVRAPIYVKGVELMQDEIAQLRGYLRELTTDTSDSRDHSLAQSIQQRIECLEASLQQLGQFHEEVDGLTRWMEEVDTFLKSEEAAFGDLVTLGAQLKESNALQEDIETLRPNVDAINDSGRTLQQRCTPRTQCQLRGQLEDRLKAVNGEWTRTVDAARARNEQLRDCMRRSTAMNELINQVLGALEPLEKEAPALGIGESIKEASELSQRASRLMQVKHKIERKQSAVAKLRELEQELRPSEAADSSSSYSPSPLEKKCAETCSRWCSVIDPILAGHASLKEATAEYGEFKTLAAQESDWLERLEKKLRKGVHSAADAEEISEELDDLENFLHHHPDDRLDRLEALAEALGAKNVLIAPVATDAAALRDRFQEVSARARKRTQLLEGGNERTPC